VVTATGHTKSRTRRSRCGTADGEPIDHTLALGFLDLIEIRFVDVFRKVDVSWAMLRRANERTQQMFGGSQLNLADVDPWPTAVSGASVLNAVSATFRRYVVLFE
jgi:hypothetical protein